MPYKVLDIPTAVTTPGLEQHSAAETSATTIQQPHRKVGITLSKPFTAQPDKVSRGNTATLISSYLDFILDHGSKASESNA
jgi:hypothetical protein